MEKGRKDPLAKVDDGKRDFLKKMAIGTAYAVPVMTTFSLDGVRNTALAQGTYAPPEVTDLQAGNNRLEVTFSRPMDTGSVSGNASAAADSCWRNIWPGCSGVGSWAWKTPQKRVWTGCGCFPATPYTVLINMEPCFGPVLGKDGQPCLPFSGTAIVAGDCPK